MTNTNVKKTCKYHAKLQSAVNTARNRVQSLKSSGVVNDAASTNYDRVKTRRINDSRLVCFSVPCLPLRDCFSVPGFCWLSGGRNWTVWWLPTVNEEIHRWN